MDTSSRRKFLGICLGGLLAGAASAILYPVYRYLAPRRKAQSGQKVSFPLAEVPEGKAKFFDYHGQTAVVVHEKGGEVVALSAVCTHLGCIVQWETDKYEFLCPCHGGRYSVDGTVLAGPPPRPLPKFPVAVENGTVTVG